MVRHNTVGRRFNPVQSKKRRGRRRKSTGYSGSSERIKTNDGCFPITLFDVGDIDDKELNTIPNSIQQETPSWWKKPESDDNSLSSNTNPLLQVQSVDFCPLCTKKLLDIHENDSADNVCDHGNRDDGRRKHVAQSIMEIIRSITEGRFSASVGNKRENSKIQTSMMNMSQNSSKTLNIHKEIKCSMSTLSMLAMHTSESTMSTLLTQDSNLVVKWPPQTSFKPEPMAKQQIETVVGALIMELCKATAAKIDQPSTMRKKSLLAKDPYMPRLENARHGRPTIGYSADFSQWLKELCQEDSKRPKRGILKKARSQIDKSKINIFRPLLCTKLSIPWVVPKRFSQITSKKQCELGMLQRIPSVMKQAQNQDAIVRTRDSKKNNSNGTPKRDSIISNLGGTKLLAHHARAVRYRSSDSVVPFQQLDVPLRLFASKREVKPMGNKRDHQEDYTEDKISQGSITSHRNCQDNKIKEKQVKEICPKCQSSIQCSIAIRKNSPKLRKIRTKTHNVLAYPCKSIVKKTKPSSQQEKRRQHQLERKRVSGKTRSNFDPTTKYFIKSFFTGTSTSETTKPALKPAQKTRRRRKLRVPPRISGYTF